MIFTNPTGTVVVIRSCSMDCTFAPTLPRIVRISLSALGLSRAVMRYFDEEFMAHHPSFDDLGKQGEVDISPAEDCDDIFVGTGDFFA